ncbi:MAG TPA: carbonic anhydrase, partial [Bacteroidales bacterium]|nr:carbonic anhydrase [Bacteroidales bacterium]
PNKALDRLILGNQRFATDKNRSYNYANQVKETSSGQYPYAAILSCIDSRVPPEIIFDQGIGEIFVARVAGNIVNRDILGSLEYACGVAGSKLIVVLGHTACGAVTSAVNGVKMGNITHLLGNIKPAVLQISNAENNVDEVARKNVELSMRNIRSSSPDLAQMEAHGEILIRGAMYDVTSGLVTFID